MHGHGHLQKFLSVIGVVGAWRLREAENPPLVCLSMGKCQQVTLLFFIGSSAEERIKCGGASTATKCKHRNHCIKAGKYE